MLLLSLLDLKFLWSVEIKLFAEPICAFIYSSGFLTFLYRCTYKLPPSLKKKMTVAGVVFTR